jgi:hypothetical protein
MKLDLTHIFRALICAIDQGDEDQAFYLTQLVVRKVRVLGSD